MTRRYNSLIVKEERWFVARCLEVAVTSQGKTIEEAHANLQEAVDLYAESFGSDDLPPENERFVVVSPLEVAVMPKLPVLSGREMIRLWEKDGFDEVRQKGSHVSLQETISSASVLEVTRKSGRWRSSDNWEHLCLDQE